MDLADIVLILGVLVVPSCLSFLAGFWLGKRTSCVTKPPELGKKPAQSIESGMYWRVPGSASKWHSFETCNSIEARSDLIQVEICKSCKACMRHAFCKRCLARKVE